MLALLPYSSHVYFIVPTLMIDEAVGVVLSDVGGLDFGSGWVHSEIT